MKKLLLVLFSSFILHPSAFAESTVYGYLQGSVRAPALAQVKIAQTNVEDLYPTLEYRETITVTATNGYWITPLNPGQYRATTGPYGDAVTFNVPSPADTNTYNYLDLQTNILPGSFGPNWVLVDTNGNVIWPTNFWLTSSNAVNAVVNNNHGSGGGGGGGPVVTNLDGLTGFVSLIITNVGGAPGLSEVLVTNGNFLIISNNWTNVATLALLAAQGTADTNFAQAVGTALTNALAAQGMAVSNFTIAQIATLGTSITNALTVQGGAITNALAIQGVAVTNAIAALGANDTNFSQSIGASITNGYVAAIQAATNTIAGPSLTGRIPLASLPSLAVTNEQITPWTNNAPTYWSNLATFYSNAFFSSNIYVAQTNFGNYSIVSNDISSPGLNWLVHANGSGFLSGGNFTFDAFGNLVIGAAQQTDIGAGVTNNADGFNGNGAGLTNYPAGKLIGTVTNRLAYTNAATNVFTADPTTGATFGGAVTIGGVTKIAWPSGTGTVTSVSGDGTVESGTITTSGSFTLGNAAPNTMLGNSTGSTAAPIYTGNPSVSNLTVTSNSTTALTNTAAVFIGINQGANSAFIGNGSGLTNLPISRLASAFMGSTSISNGTAGTWLSFGFPPYGTALPEIYFGTPTGSIARTITAIEINVIFPSISAGTNIYVAVRTNAPGAARGTACIAALTNLTTYASGTENLSVTTGLNGIIGANLLWNLQITNNCGAGTNIIGADMSIVIEGH